MRTDVVRRVEGIPTVADLDDLNGDLKVMTDTLYVLERPNAEFWTRPELLGEVKAAVGSLTQMRQRWEAVDRPATPKDIAGEVAKLSVVFAHSTGKDPDLFVEVFAEDIADAKPTKYELAVASKTYRRNFRFLGIADFMDELKEARHAARRRRELFDNLADAAPELKKIEAALPQLIAEHRNAERRSKQKI